MYLFNAIHRKVLKKVFADILRRQEVHLSMKLAVPTKTVTNLSYFERGFLSLEYLLERTRQEGRK